MIKGPENQRPNVIPESLIQAENPLDSKHVVGLMIGSFSFSQGSAFIQRRVFDYYHFLHPEYTITPELFSESIDMLEMRVLSIATSEGHTSSVSSGEILGEARSLFSEMQETFNAPPLPQESGEGLLVALTKDLLVKDFSYLCIRGERPKNSSFNSPYDPFLDPYLSFTHYFALERDKTGELLHPQRVPELQTLYKKIGDLLLSDADIGSIKLSSILKNGLSRTFQRQIKHLGLNIPSLQGKPHEVLDENREIDLRAMLSDIEEVYKAKSERFVQSL